MSTVDVTCPEYALYQALRKQITRRFRVSFMLAATLWLLGMLCLGGLSPDPTIFLVVLIGTPLFITQTVLVLLALGRACSGTLAQVALEALQQRALERDRLSNLTKLVRTQVQQWRRPWDVALLRACEEVWQQLG